MCEVTDDNADNTDDNNDGECSEDEVEPPCGGVVVFLIQC